MKGLGGSLFVIIRKMGCVGLLEVIQQFLAERGDHDGQKLVPFAAFFEDLVSGTWKPSFRNEQGLKTQSRIETVRVRDDVSGTIC